MYKALCFNGGQTANQHLGAQHRQDDRHRAMRYVVGFPGVRIGAQPQQLVLSAIVRKLSPLFTVKRPRIGGIRHGPTLIQHRPDVGGCRETIRGALIGSGLGLFLDLQRFSTRRCWHVDTLCHWFHYFWSRGVKYLPLRPLAATRSAPGAYKRIRTGPPAGLGHEIHHCGFNSPNPAVMCPPTVFA